MTKKKITLDFGHYENYNKGVCYYEGNNNFHFGMVLKQALEATGNYTVNLTRKTIKENPSLAQRGQMAKGSDLFLSLHSDASPNSNTRGVTVLDDVNPKYANKDLATKLGKGIAKALGTNFREVVYRQLNPDVWGKNPKYGASNYYGVLRNAYANHNMLIEHGFHTNAQDCNAFKTRHKEVAQVYVDVLNEFYGFSKSSTTYTRKQFIAMIHDDVLASCKQSGLLPSFVFAQAILESDNGNSELARNANNIFGIKASAPWSHAKYAKKSAEYVNGKMVQHVSEFRKYGSWKDSIYDHGRFFTSTETRKKLYKNVYTAKDWKTAVNALTGTYATDPNYAKKLTQTINSEGLDKYDKPRPTHNNNPYYGVFVLNEADIPSAQEIVKNVRGAVLFDWMKTPVEMFDEVVQVGSGKTREEYTHLAGENRVRTMEEVKKWIENHK